MRAPFGLAAVLMAALAGPMTACVVPLPIEEQPLEPNQPPFFDPLQVVPAYDQILEFDPTQDSEIAFQLPAVGDYNIDDALHWQVFVNYNAEFNRGVLIQSDSAGVPATGAVLREDDAVQFSILPCRDLASFPEVDIHRIDLIVADRPFDRTDPSNQRLTEGAQQFRLTWFLTFPINDCPANP